MNENHKVVIVKFIQYLKSDSVKYKFINGGWSYDRNIHNFIDYCYDNGIVLSYNSVEERTELYSKDIEDMSLSEIRKYLFILFNCERFADGLIMRSISTNKLALALERLIKFWED